MKLSEAIRLGIGAVTERRELYFGIQRDGNPCGCAIGTALYVVGQTDLLKGPRWGFTAIEIVWPWTKEEGVSSLISLRHQYGESRESIAAWIATIEPQDDQAPALPDVCEAESRA